MLINSRVVITVKNCVLLLAFATFNATVTADIAVIASPDVPVIDKTGLKKIFLKKSRAFSNGLSAIPCDLPDENPLKWRFYESVIDKKPAQINSYWSRALFTSSAEPPRVYKTESSLINTIQSGSGLIGYIDVKQVKPDMNIVYIEKE
jgi:hypothetical protein